MFFLSPGPHFIVQTPTQVIMLEEQGQQVRRIRLNVPHSENPKPSWYGESVGRYEGDTLVIDTIGLNAKTVVDIYRTPHTEQLHVVERWRKIDGGKTMVVVFTVEDPGAFYKPWTAKRRYRLAGQEPLEKICAENNTNLFDYRMPEASKQIGRVHV